SHCAASPTVTRFLATAVTDPLFESTIASPLVAELVDFAAACRLDYATSPFAESTSVSVCPPSVGGGCALGTDVLEDRQEEFECFAAAVPHLVSMQLAPEGDPDAPDILTPRSSAEAIEGTYVDEVPPPCANIVSGMWIFRVKRLPGSPPVFKARYVACGFNQLQGVDFFQTFSPTPKMTTLRVLLHVAAQRDYELHSLDFSTAFLQGSLHEEIWLRCLPDFTGSFPAGTQWSLRRPVYGLRQAPREWHDTLKMTLAALGFAPSTADPSLFLRTHTTLPPFYVLVYVDDLVFATTDTKALAHVKSELQKRHMCTDLGEMTSSLGLRITRDRAQRTITLTQSHMVHQVLQRFGFTYSSPQSTPLPTGHSLSAPPSDEPVEPSGPYPKLVGCLMYLMTCTRPDLAYPLSLLARYMAPGMHRKVHWDAAKRVLRYLCSTSGMGLVLGGRARVVLTGHADASWVDDLATQRSSQGYTFSLSSGFVSWRSTRSSSVLSSNCEAEIYAGAMAAQELRWLTYLLTDLGEAPHSPPVLYVDNKAMLALCQEHTLEHRTKHIALRHFLAQELQQCGKLRLAYVATRANTADVFTKALQPCDHQRFCTVLGIGALRLKNVLWVPNLAANLISVRRLQKAGMDTSSKGAKTYTARLGERFLWDLHEDRDVYNEMWQILVVPMPKERQVAANISTKGEAVGSGDGANGRAKEMKSKKCKLGGTSKLGEHKESGAAAQKQHKGEENPKAAAEEEYGENMWGTIASAAFSNPTSPMGECDWLTLHRRMGHVALPILQQLVKNEMVAGKRVKGEPDEVLGCSTCMQAKFTRFPFSSSEATTKAPLDEVVMDVVVPLKLGAAGAEYFLTIVDVYTRMTWVYVLSKKSDVAETVKTDWLPMVERQQDRLVKAIRTDRGGEFLGKDFGLWLKKNGIRHSLTMPYSPAMNGIAERANRTITETARGLLIEAGLPDYFWPDAVRSACVAKNRALTHVGADKWVPYVEWIGRKPKVDMLRVFGCMCMALVPKHLRHNKLGAKAIWAVHLGMAQNSKGWLLWDPFTKKFLVSRDCKFMENLMYKDWKAENEAKIGLRLGDVKSSGLEHVELPLELSSGSTTTRQSSLVNGGEEAKDAEEEEEEVQQVSERAPTLPSRTTSAPRIRVTSQQRQGLHVPVAEEEGRGKRIIQAPNRLTYDALGKPAKSALAGAALMVGEDEESDYEECAFAFFSPVEMPGEPATLKEALESSDAEEWKKAMESELKSIEENGTWELFRDPSWLGTVWHCSTSLYLGSWVL
ncbi:unnamed protein product, partial [Closterium sp. NIES-53]